MGAPVVRREHAMELTAGACRKGTDRQPAGCSTRGGRPQRPRFLAGAAGFGLTLAPWLAWAIPVYGIPVPFVGRHPRIFHLADFALPHGLGSWSSYLGRLVHYFWFPCEWQLPSGTWRWLDLATLSVGSLLLVVATVWEGCTWPGDARGNRRWTVRCSCHPPA